MSLSVYIVHTYSTHARLHSESVSVVCNKRSCIKGVVPPGACAEITMGLRKREPVFNYVALACGISQKSFSILTVLKHDTYLQYWSMIHTYSIEAWYKTILWKQYFLIIIEINFAALVNLFAMWCITLF